MQQQHAIEFFFIAEANSLWGFHWLIEWSTSSFYVKCLHPAMQSAKVSLHGPDPKHPGKQHLRFDLDHADVLEKATKAGSHWSSGSDRLPFYWAVGRSTTTPPTSCDFQPSGTPSSRGHQGRATRGVPERSRPFVPSSAHRRGTTSPTSTSTSALATRIGPTRRPPVQPKPEWAPSPTPSG